MPLEEVLDILDLLVEELPEFLEKYELNSDITWRSWVKKYWILVPVAATAFGIKIYLTYKNGINPDSKSVELPTLPVIP